MKLLAPLIKNLGVRKAKNGGEPAHQSQVIPQCRRQTRRRTLKVRYYSLIVTETNNLYNYNYFKKEMYKNTSDGSI